MAPTEQQAKASKAKQLGGGKVPKARVQRYLKSTESKLKENGKSALLLKGRKVSLGMQKVLQELRALRAPSVKLLNKKNEVDAFHPDGQESLEFLTTKNDCALFAMASHNKKRPHNLVLGRTFDRQVLDMAELGVVRFKSMNDYGGTVPKKRVGSKPLLLFVGSLWQQSTDHQNLQNLLIDFYRGDVVDKLIVTGIDHVLVFTLGENSVQAGGSAPVQRNLIHQRTYHVQLKKNPSGGQHPVPLLTPCGPDMDMILRRTQWAADDLAKAARVQPKATKSKKKKNLSTNIFGETVGRLHLTKQDVDQRQGKKVKALKRAEKEAANEESAALQSELDREKDADEQELREEFGFAP